MLWGLIASFFDSLGTIFRRKAILSAKKVSGLGIMFFGSFFPLIFVASFFLDFIPTFHPKIFLMVFVICVLATIAIQMSQYAYKNEKVSVLTPYENVNKVFSLIFSFLLFKDVSFISLCIALFIVFLVIFTSLDIKKLYISPIIKILLVQQFIRSCIVLFIAYILKEITSFEYYFLENIFIVFLAFLFIVSRKETASLVQEDRKFYLYRVLGASTGGIGYFIGIFIIEDLGVSLAILFSFFYLFFTLLLSYFFFKDTPSKKSIWLSLIILILIGFGFYFR